MILEVKVSTLILFLQGILGGVDKVDSVGFEAIWNNVKGKYVSEVKTCAVNSHVQNNLHL